MSAVQGPHQERVNMTPHHASLQENAAPPPALHRDLLLQRHYPAPPAEVFRAWTDERRMAKWFGPQGFSCPRCIFEPRAGGVVHIDMKGPDGTLYPSNGKVREVTRPRRLVFQTSVPDSSGPPVFEMLHTLTFVEAPGGTLLVWLSRLLNAKLGAASYLEGHEAGCHQTLDRLGVYLASMDRR